jgi:hypothetical protein
MRDFTQEAAGCCGEALSEALGEDAATKADIKGEALVRALAAHAAGKTRALLLAAGLRTRGRPPVASAGGPHLTHAKTAHDLSQPAPVGGRVR